MILEDQPWSDQEKRDFVWRCLLRLTKAAGSNIAIYNPLLFTTPDERMTLFLEPYEQRKIINDFAREGKINLLGLKEDGPNEITFEVLEPNRQRESCYSQRIKNKTDLLKDLELRESVIDFFNGAFNADDPRQITANQSVNIEVPEKEDELLLLLDELGFTKTDWDSLRYQVQHIIWDRSVKVLFIGEKIKPFIDAVYGKTSKISTKALNIIAEYCSNLLSREKLNDFFIDIGVPSILLIAKYKSRKDFIDQILLVLLSSGELEDEKIATRLLEGLVHPYIFGGERKKAENLQYVITDVLRYDKLSLIGGKLHELNMQDEEALATFENSKNPNTYKEGPKLSNIITTNNINNKLEKLGINNKGIFMPEGTRWEELLFKFIDGNNIKLFIKDTYNRDVSFTELGLMDTRKIPLRTNNQGLLLILFSIKNGELHWSDQEATKKYIKHKQLLNKALKAYFHGIQGEPIKWIKRDGVYRSSIVLIPEKEPLPFEDKSDKLSDLDSEYLKLTPSVYRDE